MGLPLKGTKALLLAGGLGTRLYPITKSTPKCLVKIDGRPLLDFWLQTLIEAGIDRILINTHYLSEQTESYCKQSKYRDWLDLVYEPKLLGTAGTLRANRHYFSDRIFLAHADNFTLFDPDLFMHTHLNRPPQCQGTMMTFITDSPSSCGIVEVNDEGILIDYHEKVKNPPGNLANAAVFLLEQPCLQWLDENSNAVDFCKEIVPLGIGKFQTFQNTLYHRDIGTIDSLKQANIDYPKIIKTSIKS